MSAMSTALVAPAKIAANQSLTSGSDATSVLEERDEVRIAVAKALAQGYSSKQVAKAFGKRLVPFTTKRTTEDIARAAYSKVRRWMTRDQAFRDLIYQQAVVELDLKTPLILGGVARAAQRGRVDAARLALEIVGRIEKDQVVSNVTVQIANIPRPDSA